MSGKHEGTLFYSAGHALLYLGTPAGYLSILLLKVLYILKLLGVDIGPVIRCVALLSIFVYVVLANFYSLELCRECFLGEEILQKL